MPITLPPLSRRRFLKSTLAAGAGLALRPWEILAAGPNIDPNRLAFFSDIHIPADKAFKHQTGVVQYEHMETAVKQVVGMSPRPAAAVVCGDCAYLKGLPEDYASLVDVVAPVREAGLPLHFALGNHDHRENFWKALPSDARERTAPDRHITILPLPHANIFILDSLEQTNLTPGTLGEAQRDWLAKALDARPDKPAVLLIHHQLDRREKISGLTDTADLLDIVLPRKQVKAWLFGHTHVWQLLEEQGVHLLNLPTVAYVFTKEQPTGWVEADFRPDGATFTLRAIDPDHPKNGEKHELKWR